MNSDRYTLYFRGDDLAVLEAELVHVEEELRQARAEQRRFGCNGATVGNRAYRRKFLKAERRRLLAEQGVASEPTPDAPESAQLGLL